MKYLVIVLVLFGSDVWGKVSASGGRYYLEREGVKELVYYTTEYTAFVAAVNMAESCLCDVVVLPPRVVIKWLVDVNTTFKGVELTWDIPTQREDGSVLPLDQIKGYIITVYVTSNEMNSAVSTYDIPVGKVNSYLFTGSEREFAIRTVDSNGVEGKQSGRVIVSSL